MTRNSLLATAALAAAVLFTASSAQAVAIVNGSFETGATVDGSFITLANGSTAIDGWVVGGLGVDWINEYWQPADGERSIDLSGNNKGSISQLLTGLLVGQTYNIDFYLAGNPDGGASTKVAVASDGGSQSSVYFFPQAGNTKEDMGWTKQTFTFIATDTTANLAFSATQFDPYGPALDNVSIRAVPEPATWALMIMGFGGAGAMIRRRRPQLA